MTAYKRIEMGSAYLSECIYAMLVGRFYESCLEAGIIKDVRRDPAGILSFDFWSPSAAALEEFFTCLVSPFAVAPSWDLVSVDQLMPEKARRDLNRPVNSSVADYSKAIENDFSGPFHMLCDFSVWQLLLEQRLVHTEVPEFRSFCRIVMGVQIRATSNVGECMAGTRWDIRYYPRHALPSIEGFMPFENFADFSYDMGRAAMLPLSIQNARGAELEAIQEVLVHPRIADLLEDARLNSVPRFLLQKKLQLVKKICFSFWAT